MGITIDTYVPFPNFPEFTTTAYICFDINNPITIRRDMQTPSVYNLEACFRVYKTLQDRTDNPNSSINLIMRSIRDINMAGNISTIAYNDLKTNFPNATIVDDL